MARRPRKAEAVADAIAADLEQMPPGAWLPTWREMTKQYDVAIGTIENARGILVERGLIEVVPNRGARKPHPPRRLSRNEGDHARVVEGARGFAVAMKDLGYEAWDTLIAADDVEAPRDVAERLGLPIATPVLRRSRVHGIYGPRRERIPVMLSWTWVNPAISAQLPVLYERKTGDGGMTSRFEEELKLRVWWEDAFTARIATDSEAQQLELPAGSPVQDAWRRCFDQDGRVLEVTRRVIDSRSYTVVFRFGDMPGTDD